MFHLLAILSTMLVANAHTLEGRNDLLDRLNIIQPVWLQSESDPTLCLAIENAHPGDFGMKATVKECKEAGESASWLIMPGDTAIMSKAFEKDLCLTAGDGSTSDSSLFLADCNPGGSTEGDQVWVYNDDTPISLKSQGICLWFKGADDKDTATVQLAMCKVPDESGGQGDSDQMWNVVVPPVPFTPLQ